MCIEEGLEWGDGHYTYKVRLLTSSIDVYKVTFSGWVPAMLVILQYATWSCTMNSRTTYWMTFNIPSALYPFRGKYVDNYMCLGPTLFVIKQKMFWTVFTMYLIFHFATPIQNEGRLYFSFVQNFIKKFLLFCKIPSLSLAIALLMNGD